MVQKHQVGKGVHDDIVEFLTNYTTVQHVKNKPRYFDGQSTTDIKILSIV